MTRVATREIPGASQGDEVHIVTTSDAELLATGVRNQLLKI